MDQLLPKTDQKMKSAIRLINKFPYLTLAKQLQEFLYSSKLSSIFSQT